jgi:uncharacterized protein (TIGR00255 family)
MIKSMTGYGKAKCSIADKSVSIELKSLNSKHLDIYTKIPNIYREKDLELRNDIAAVLKRGKIELTITIEYSGKELASQINPDVIKEYYQQLQVINKDLDIKNMDSLLQVIMRLPEVLKTEIEELDPEEWELVRKSVNKAINELDSFRVKEGLALSKDLLKRINLIETYLDQIKDIEKQRIDNIRKRLTGSLNELLEQKTYDPDRFEQELIYYLEKLDITEERIRLKNHCNYFTHVMNENNDNSIGKKLNFIAQEAGREINTLGAKASDFEIQRLVVMMKDELEKIREQLMNII